MSIDVQCRCGKTLKAPDAMAGKRGRCKACGATLIVPDAMIDDDDAGDVPLAAAPPVADDSDDAVAAAVIPDDPPISISLQPRQRSRAAAPNAGNREPWFYGFLELWAGLALLAAALQASVAVLAIVIAVTIAGENETSSARAVGASAFAYAAVGAFAGCLGSITLAALIRMLVDIGRSLRGINQRGGG